MFITLRAFPRASHCSVGAYSEFFCSGLWNQNFYATLLSGKGGKKDAGKMLKKHAEKEKKAAKKAEKDLKKSKSAKRDEPEDDTDSVACFCSFVGWRCQLMARFSPLGQR